MATTDPDRDAVPRAERVLRGTLGFLGVTALGGGIEMLAFPHGNRYLPLRMLEGTGLSSFVAPGVVLTGAFGVGSLVVLRGLRRRQPWALLAPLERRSGRHWSWLGAVAVGAGFTTWMSVEVALLGLPWRDTDAPDEAATATALYGIYGTTAVLLLALPWHPDVMGSLERSE